MIRPTSAMFRSILFVSLTLVAASESASIKSSVKLPFLQHGLRKRNQIIAEDDLEWQKITECVQPVYDAGHYIYHSEGLDNVETCGLYVIAAPDKIIQIEFDLIDVTCQSGLIAYFDGWEMNGRIFPSESDHDLPLKERITEFCGHENNQELKFRSSQNAALVQYRVPKAGEGFSVKVTIHENPKPCNILMSEMSGLFTLTNFGNENRNCTLTTLLFPANFQIADFKVGPPSHAMMKDKKTKIIVKDEKVRCGSRDFLEVGGSSDLETSDLETKADICEWPLQKTLTVLCGSSTIRLVSSGNFSNSLTVLVRAADENDLVNDHNNSLMVCPNFSA